MTPVLQPASAATNARGLAQQYVDRVLGQMRQQYHSFDQFPYRSWVTTCVVGALTLWSVTIAEWFMTPRAGDDGAKRLLAPLAMGCWFAALAWRHRRFDREFRREAEWSLALTTTVFVIMVQVNGIRPVMILSGSIVSMYIAQRRWVARTGAAVTVVATMIASSRFPADQVLFWRALWALMACVLLMEWLMQLVDRAMDTLHDASQSLDTVSMELVADRERLVEATARAEREAQRKTDLMAIVSHEIRTPMNAILGLSSLMLQSPIDPQQREWLQRMRENGQHLVGLVNDLLDYTRIASGKAMLEQAPFHLDDVMAQVQDVLQREAMANDLAVSWTVADDVPSHVSGDRRRLTQLLLNYVTNAVKYTPRGRIDVRVTALTRDDHLMLRVEVQDTGVGMTEEQQARCFLPFEQFAPERGDGTGAGLGLAICQWIAAQMQGEVGVESVAGQGSTFWFVVQLDHAAPVSRELSSVASADGMTVMPALDGVRVLVVDDSRINRVVVREVLRRVGVEVTEAETGAAALAWLAGHRVDVVVMDLQMPGMNGLEATRRAREQFGAACPPIIAMTASTQPGDEQRCLDAGMVAFLAKPFEAEQLQWEVARWGYQRGRFVTPVPAEQVPGRIATPVPSMSNVSIADTAPDLAAVRGLDVTGGLRRMAGDMDAYRALLADLVRDHAASIRVIRAALEQGHRTDAVTLVHALSGTCAILGATDARAALRTLEGLLVDDAPIAACLTALQAAADPFEALLHDLRRVTA